MPNAIAGEGVCVWGTTETFILVVEVKSFAVTPIPLN